MRTTSLVYSSLLLHESTALAVPLLGHRATDGILDNRADPLLGDLNKLISQAADLMKNPSPIPGSSSFDPKTQLISTSGDHQFVAPGPDDPRGPCPGLNALANHGYLPRNGRANVVQFIQATTDILALSPDVAVFLALFGAVNDGDLVSWSIAGKPRDGISGSHGHYESDSSPLRGDLNQYGRNDRTILSQFERLFDMQPDPATANYNVDVLTDWRDVRYKESIAKNPYFVSGLITGFISEATHMLIPECMSNHSAEYPDGILDQETLKSFYAITGDRDNFTYTPGHERIPDNWYRRPRGHGFSFAGALVDINGIHTKYPETSGRGCNMGKSNTFNLFPQAILDALSKPLGSACYMLALSASPNTESSTSLLLRQQLTQQLQKALGCPTSSALNGSVEKTCPGATFYGGPTGPIAPGAIMN